MQILPLKFIHHDDKKHIGLNLFNLAKLKHSGLPVVESVIVSAPEEPFEKIIAKYSRFNHTLKNHLPELKQEILRIPVPEKLTEIALEFDNQNGFNVSLGDLWNKLLEKWVFEIISKIERDEINLALTPQQVVFSSNFNSLGSAFFDENKKHVVITVENGELDFKKSEEIEKIVLLGNKRLVLPQIFYWVIERDKVKIMKVMPFTQSPLEEEKEVRGDLEKTPQKTPVKTATKILLDYRNEVLNDLDTEEVLYRVQNPNIEAIDKGINKILKLKEPVIIFYPDFANSPEKNLEFARSFVFFKNKKRIKSQIVLPQTFSFDEFLLLKRQYASLGIYSKGNLKIWKQFFTVADFINMDSYIDGGFDGALIDLDKIISLVIGIDPEKFLSEPRKDWIRSIEEFFNDSKIRQLIKKQKPVLIFGKTARNEELLNYFIKLGVWGIAFEDNLINPLREHIAYLEKNAVKSTKV